MPSGESCPNTFKELHPKICFRSRLNNGPAEEVHIGVEEVKKISRLRIEDLVVDDAASKL